MLHINSSLDGQYIRNLSLQAIFGRASLTIFETTPGNIESVRQILVGKTQPQFHEFQQELIRLTKAAIPFVSVLQHRKTMGVNELPSCSRQTCVCIDVSHVDVSGFREQPGSGNGMCDPEATIT